MKAYGGVEVLIHSLITSVLDGGDRSASRPDCYASEESKFIYYIIKFMFDKLFSHCV